MAFVAHGSQRLFGRCAISALLQQNAKFIDKRRTCGASNPKRQESVRSKSLPEARQQWSCNFHRAVMMLAWKKNSCDSYFFRIRAPSRIPASWRASSTLGTIRGETCKPSTQTGLRCPLAWWLWVLNPLLHRCSFAPFRFSFRPQLVREPDALGKQEGSLKLAGFRTWDVVNSSALSTCNFNFSSKHFSFVWYLFPRFTSS